ncbi:unnamed protein product [Symbiodinium pilosum]|uniref:Protein kinase domain-containing protein n=1 Tax=Symbiodinium pilosum TaxID=2952 RepID=A0A812NLU9_SYMPI|nr:unnamed protein product [Symbiodinium pilosum]
MATVQTAISAWKDAQQTLESAVRELPDDAEIWRRLLSIHEQLKDSKGQHLCHRRLVQLGASTPATQTSYASLLLSEDRVREAREQLSQVIKLEPTNLTALLKLAHCHRQDARESNLEEAKKLYEQVLNINPSNLEALEGAAYCARKGNQTDQAVHFYQQCLKVSATAEGPLYYLGDILYRQHRHAECQFYLSRLVDTNCTTDYKTGALYLLAKSYVSLDEYEEAEKQARLGLALKPNHPHFLFILALVKNRMADFDSSIATLKKAFLHLSAADSDNLKVEIHDWLAQAYERKGEYTNALAELSLAFKQEPSHVSSLITQGLIHVQMKELEQAETSYRKALAVEKNHALALVRLGYCKLLVGDLQEAILLFQRALQQRCGTVALPRSVKGCARIYMALAMMGQQDMDGAIYQLTEARKSHRNFESLCTSGKDSIVRGECEGLVSRLRSMSDLDVTLAQAWQLVELMAKELEMGLRDPSSQAGKGSSPESAGQSPVREFSTTASSPENQAKKVFGEATPSAGPERRAWVSSALPPADAALPERRQWTSVPAQADPPKTLASSTNLPLDQGKILLAKHEMIDFAALTQKDCLGSGGFGAVYRGFLGTREVAIKKLFCEDGGNISPLQLEELEKEVAALRSLNHPRLVGFIGAHMMYCASAKSETAAGATGWLVVTFTAEGNRRKPSSWNYEFRRCAMETSLVSLVGHGDLDAVKRHLDQIRRTHGQAAVVNEIITCEHEGRNAKSAFHRAALRGRAEIISLFLSEEVPVDVLDEQGNTPLHLATDLGRARATHHLLEARACINMRNCFGRSAKDMAATNSWDEQSIADGKALIRRMLEAENVPLDNLPAEPPAVPHQVEDNGILKAELLQEQRVDRDIRSPGRPKSSWESPDEVACPVTSSWTRIMVGGDQKSSKIMWSPTVSYSKMADDEFLAEVCLQTLVKQEDVSSVKRWLSCKRRQPPLPGETSETAVFAAVGSCEFSETGEDTRIAQSALHLAALRGYVEILMLLLETRIDPNVTNDQGSTPLHLAVDLDRAEAAQLLLKFKANPCLRNNFGRTPYGMRDGVWLRFLVPEKTWILIAGSISLAELLIDIERRNAQYAGKTFSKVNNFVFYLVCTRFMPGGSLHHLLHKARTPLTLGTQSKMAIQVCEGVDFLHGHSPPVVHRDLKSLNIVLDRIYNAKICDFGLTQSMEKTHITLKEGGNGGSPRYMAPECYDCKGKITEKVDVWALGCILVEVFGGPLPYDDCQNIQQIVAKAPQFLLRLHKSDVFAAHLKVNIAAG